MGIEDRDRPAGGEEPLKEKLPAPVGLLVFELISPGGVSMASDSDGSMVAVRVKKPLKVLVTVMVVELGLATVGPVLAPPVPPLIGGK